MRFLAPAMLALLALLPLVVVLHQLRSRSPQHTVTTLFLWSKSSQNANSRFDFQRLKLSTVLFLQLVILTLLIASLARPAYRQFRPFSKGQVAVIIDNSASMLALVKPRELQTRFDLAKSVAHQLVDQLNAERQMVVLPVSDVNLLLDKGITFTSAQQHLHQTIDKMSVRTTEIDLSMLSTRTLPVEVIFITDHHRQHHDSITSIRRVYVGQNIKNIAITEIQLTTNLNHQPNVKVRVEWFDIGFSLGQQSPVELQILIDDVWFASRFVSRPNNHVQTIVFDLSTAPLQSQIITAKLKIEDGLALDNSANLIFQSKNNPELVLVNDRWPSPLNVFLANHPDINLTLATTDTYNPNFGDIVVYDQIIPNWTAIEDQPQQNLLFINPRKNLPFAKILNQNKVSMVTDQHQHHPIMETVPVLGLKIRSSTHYQLPIWATTLVSAVSSNGVTVPIIWVGQRPNGQKIGLISFDAFNLRQSRFALMIPEMPIIMAQLIEWLTPPLRLIERSTIRAGSIIRLNQHLTSGKISIRQPNGSIVDVHKPIFKQTDQIGIYIVLADGQPVAKFTANLLSPSESNLSTKETGSWQVPPINSKAVLAQLKPSNPSYDWQEFWYYLVVLALLGLLIEWIIYRQRMQI